MDNPWNVILVVDLHFDFGDGHRQLDWSVRPCLYSMGYPLLQQNYDGDKRIWKDRGDSAKVRNCLIGFDVIFVLKTNEFDVCEKQNKKTNTQKLKF